MVLLATLIGYTKCRPVDPFCTEAAPVHTPSAAWAGTAADAQGLASAAGRLYTR